MFNGVEEVKQNLQAMFPMFSSKFFSFFYFKLEDNYIVFSCAINMNQP